MFQNMIKTQPFIDTIYLHCRFIHIFFFHWYHAFPQFSRKLIQAIPIRPYVIEFNDTAQAENFVDAEQIFQMLHNSASDNKAT